MTRSNRLFAFCTALLATLLLVDATTATTDSAMLRPAAAGPSA